MAGYGAAPKLMTHHQQTDIMRTTCQILIVLQLVFIFFTSLHSDFNGSKGKPPYGYVGAVCSVVITALLALVYWGAGAFSTL